LPSWDSFLDEYARLGPGSPENSLIGLLHRWLPPRWLRPIAYPLPKVAGFEGQRVTVFEVVELQDNLTALARLAEYFSEMGRLDEAAAAGQALTKMFPDETDALLGRAQVALACGERADLLEAVKQLESRIAEGAEQLLPWDRRLTLAVMLAEAKRFEAAREQFRRCLQEIDEPKIRGLSSVALFRLHALCRGFREPIPDAKLAELARKLLPPEMRAR
jgi:tetratricopeptide (TPR) repeat protein